MALASAVAGTKRSEQETFYAPVTIAFPNPYNAGGESLNWATYLPEGAVLHGAMCDANATYHLQYDRTNKKVLVYINATGAEAGAIDLSLLVDMVVTFVGA